VPPAKVDGGPTAMAERDHVAGLPVDCGPGDTWAKHP
jgi:hypothetical protein